LDIVAAQPERRHRVLRLANRLRSRLRVSGLTDDAHESPIVPVRLGSSARALAVATEVRAEGFDVRAIRPPTVPPHTARLRLSIHASHSEAEIDAVADAILRACTAHEERQAVGVSG
jgi:8-amino-7-oxononanoate synthase